MKNIEQNSVLLEDLEFIANSALIDWNQLQGKSVLITGATGLIGSQIVKALVCRNKRFGSKISIQAYIRNKEKAEKIFKHYLELGCIDLVVGDITKLNISKPVNFIIHTASITASKDFVTKPVEVIDISLIGTRNILEAARKNHSEGVVYLSSMEAFGIVNSGNKKSTEDELGEIDLTNPRSCYPESKRMAECYCSAYASEYQLPVKIARLSQTFGPGISFSENRVFAQFARAALEQNDIVLHTKGLSWGNYCYTRDTVIAILMLLTKGNPGEAYTITNEQSNVQIKDMAHMVAEKIAEGKIQVIFDIPESTLTYGYAPDTELHLSAQKMRKLGWETSIDLEEAYRRMMKCMK